MFSRFPSSAAARHMALAALGDDIIGLVLLSTLDMA